MNIEKAIQQYGADAVFTAAAAGACEDFEPLRAIGLEAYDISDADYIGQVVYKSMTPEEQDMLYQEAVASDPAVP
jgi:hypothetical protein